jgi:chromatin assembly factor 1 subunit A
MKTLRCSTTLLTFRKQSSAECRTKASDSISLAEPLPDPVTDRLNSIISSLPPPLDLNSSARGRPPYGYKVYHATSVRDIVAQLSEAEVSGDDALVRVLLSKLRDRNILPAKAFIFKEDARPGYFGTWTRSSKVIGPRRPFAKDLVVFDYGYDSGEEWEEEPVGEDVAEDNDDEEEGEDPDSDADSWLVDDDEEPEFNLRDIDSLDAPDIFDVDAPPPITAKRKADEGERKLGKKRKVVVPLVPFAKGPCWEETIGHCSYEPFQSYRIQLFNGDRFWYLLQRLSLTSH